MLGSSGREKNGHTRGRHARGEEASPLACRSLHSTVTALLEATDDWAFNIDRGNINAVVFLD